MFERFINHLGNSFEDQHIPVIEVEIEEEDNKKLSSSSLKTIPLLAVRNTVIFPSVVIPISIGREKSLQAVKKAYEDGSLIGVCSQKNAEIEDPGLIDLYQFGTAAKIVKLINMPDGGVTAVLQGKVVFELTGLQQHSPYLIGEIQLRPTLDAKDEISFKAVLSSIRDKAKRIIELSPNIPAEADMMIKNIENDNFLINFIASNLNNTVLAKQEILAQQNVDLKANLVNEQLSKELQIAEVKNQIESKARFDMEKQQRDYYLHQQMKTIQEELGQNPQQEEINELEERANLKKWPEAAQKAFDKELSKLERSNPQMAEYSVTLNYLETILDLPWEEYSEDTFDLKEVKKVLDADHFGLEKVKDRIIEHLAVLKLKDDMKAPILCLVGPPGVGKTSLGRSIADAMGRKFIRMALGGLHDESEIRGHRKTYIGALPGRIIQSIKKVSTSNPVFILDEIDKVGKDFRGDPSSALLEVLDPEQNGSFHDNYLDLDYDLSKVLFIATANDLGSIQPALRDRMEIIRLSGYSQEEKLQIAKKHLVPKQRKNHGLKAKQVKVPDSVLKRIISAYSREAGVRQLDRLIASLMRHAAKLVAMDEVPQVNIKVENLEDILGPSLFDRNKFTKIKHPGVAIGLAWTSVGGEILFVEASLSPGKGKLTLTGNLGDVMKESATTALSYIRSNAEDLGIDPSHFDTHNLHIHVPEGATPKDGPSAGITMISAITSAFTGKRLKDDLAMTGEITLRGKVLPVGGIKEKVLAAKRAGVKTIIMCKDNEKNVKEIEERYLKGLSIIYVDEMRDVVKHALRK